ncbi:UDP-N-acetyl-alpha-D-glucosamine:NAD+ 3-oxidoreductase [Hyphodiscus hymeniophilus]|uniref:UDP-N-acetyl-alpha-D-glucosamine:NAD+ 3-oxidoreductase n=1 Tax=Hyphodiscus hymeniophilus TaxID=353542 RepID=A0A9P7AUY9_9HELO|nr:UDP-N-acetyl-alpha-D-glucosamine:NAD+ 3-oxidoreductase [Hyphodiscus hymeniophilus]
MTTTPLKIAIIGGGLIGPRHAASIISNPSTILTALVDPAPHGLPTASSLKTTHYPSISALLSSPNRPDAAIICTPNKTHVSLSLELIAAGIHVLVEKPISTSIHDGRLLVDTAHEKGVKLLVGHHRRFNPYLLAAKAEIEKGGLGTTIAVQGTWCLKKPSSYFDGIGEWRRSEESGGVILINLIHEVDLLQYLLGPIISVSAMPTRKTREFDAEEGAAILFRFESGVVGTFILSDVTPSPWNFETGTGENPMIPHSRKEEGAGGFYRIMGTEASLSVPDLTRWSYDWREEKSWTERLKKEDLEVDKAKVPFDSQIQHFYEVVRNGAEPSCTGEEGLRAMIVCDAVKRALVSELPVEVIGYESAERSSEQKRSLHEQNAL